MKPFKKYFLVFLIISSIVSCKDNKIEKKEIINKSKVSNRVSSDKNNTHKSETKKFVINGVYDEEDSDFTEISINYSTGKFIIDDDFQEFIIDSTLDDEERYQTLKDFRLSQYADDRSIIRISNYTFSLQKKNGILYLGLFRRTKQDKWECKDIKELEKYSELGDYNYILGDNKVFSYACETNKGNLCYAVVIDKVNSAGKYDKILKAVKFDLVNEKIIEIDLKREKIECLPEVSDE